MPDAIVTARGLRKSFPTRRGTIEAVRGIDLDVGRGEIVGFLGPNGAGKTTTLRMLATLLPPGGGAATVAGFDVATQPGRVRARIGYVSQLGGADGFASARENLTLQGRLYGGDPKNVALRTQELIDRLDLSEFADRPVRTYSGGQRRRLDVALGIVHNPAVLFLDEPTTGLDPQNRANLWEHVRALHAQGTAVLVSTHYLEEADALCDRVLIIDHGRIVAQGTPTELKRRVAGDMVVLAFATEAECEAALRHLRPAREVCEAKVEDATLRLTVEDGSAALPALLHVLDSHSLPPRSLSLAQPTLNDVFLQCTGRTLRDVAPAEVAS